MVTPHSLNLIQLKPLLPINSCLCPKCPSGNTRLNKVGEGERRGGFVFFIQNLCHIFPMSLHVLCACLLFSTGGWGTSRRWHRQHKGAGQRQHPLPLGCCSRVIPHPSFASKEIMAQLRRPIIIFCRNSVLDQ